MLYIYVCTFNRHYMNLCGLEQNL